MDHYDPNPKPDRESLTRIADLIRSLPHLPTDASDRVEGTRYFDWSNWSEAWSSESTHTCGTYGCVAGWAVELFPDRLHIERGCVRIIGKSPLFDPLQAFGLTFREGRAITCGDPLNGPEGPEGPESLAEIPFALDEGTPIQAADRIMTVLALAEKRYARLSKEIPHGS